MRAAALAACLIAACSEPRRPAVADAGATAQAAAAPEAPRAEPVPPPLPAADTPSQTAKGAPAFRVANASGLTRNESFAELGQLLATSAEGGAAIDLPNAARVRLEPDTTVLVLRFEPCALLLIRGSVFVELLPQGNQPGRAPLRVISALGSAIVANTAELWLAQRSWPDADAGRTVAGAAVQSQLTVLRGLAEVAQPDPRGSVTSQPLAAGQLLVTGKTSKPKVAATDLDAVRSASAEFLRQRRNPLRLGLSGEPLDRARAAFHTQQSAGQALLARMTAERALAARDAGARDAGDLRALQRELANHAQQKHTLRQAFLLAAEQALSAQLVACDAKVGHVGPDCRSLRPFLALFAPAATELFQAAGYVHKTSEPNR